MRTDLVEIRYETDGAADPCAIGDLRQLVGWNRMEKSYRDPRMTSFCHVAAWAGDVLVGYIDAVSNGVTDGYIQDLMVHPDWQGHGIGTALMEKMIGILRERGIYMISVLFEESLRGFYDRFGFTVMLAGQMETRREE